MKSEQPKQTKGIFGSIIAESLPVFSTGNLAAEVLPVFSAGNLAAESFTASNVRNLAAELFTASKSVSFMRISTQNNEDRKLFDTL